MGTLNLGKLSGVVRTAAGLCVACTVAVYPSGSVNADGSLIGSPVLSTIYSDQDGDTPLANPMVSATGEYSCYIASGRYDLRITGSGLTSRGILDVISNTGGPSEYRVPLQFGTSVAVSSASYGYALSWQSSYGVPFNKANFPAGSSVYFSIVGTFAPTPDQTAYADLYDLVAGATVTGSERSLSLGVGGFAGVYRLESADLASAIASGSRTMRVRVKVSAGGGWTLHGAELRVVRT